MLLELILNLLSKRFLVFGAALTESSCYILNTIKKDISSKILEEYFSKDTLNYRFCRTSIGSCDFSLDSYSYSYENDLSDFTIKRDLKYVVPTIKLVQKLNNNLQLIASPWSPPAFMKDNSSLVHGGKLLPPYKKLWAEYLVKYIFNYQKQGISIPYMTIQNEPNAKQRWESCLYSSSEEADLLKNYLYPIFRKNGLDTQFLIWDHNKDIVLERSIETLIHSKALDYASRNCFSLVYWRTF